MGGAGLVYSRFRRTIMASIRVGSRFACSNGRGRSVNALSRQAKFAGYDLKSPRVHFSPEALVCRRGVYPYKAPHAPLRVFVNSAAEGAQDA